jgi:hypothetical protein
MSKRKVARPPPITNKSQKREFLEDVKREETTQPINTAELPKLVDDDINTLLDHLQSFNYESVCLYSTIIISRLGNLMIQRQQEQQQEIMNNLGYTVENT